MDFTDEGSSFVYGYLVTSKPYFPDAIQAQNITDNTAVYQDAAL